MLTINQNLRKEYDLNWKVEELGLRLSKVENSVAQILTNQQTQTHPLQQLVAAQTSNHTQLDDNKKGEKDVIIQMPRRSVRPTRVPAPTGPGSSEWPIAISSSPSRENPSNSDSSDSERPLDAVTEETPMPPPPVPSFVPRDIPGSGPRPRWVRRSVSAVRDFPPGCGPSSSMMRPLVAPSVTSSPIPYHVHRAGIFAPSPEVRARVRALTQMVVERARSVDRFISSEFRAVQYQDLVNWLVFELGSIGGSGSC
ncbi:hypothetical protein AgCh_012754 [Apium graveolens]